MALGLMATPTPTTGQTNMTPALQPATPQLVSGNFNSGTSNSATIPSAANPGALMASQVSNPSPASGIAVPSGTLAPTDSGVSQANTLGLYSSVNPNINNSSADSNSSGNNNSVFSNLSTSRLTNSNAASGIVNSVNTFGAQDLGIGTLSAANMGTGASAAAIGSGEVVSPTLAAADAAATPAGAATSLGATAAETATSLTGVLGAAGVGALAGNFIAGLTGGNKVTGSIGGAIGGAIGDFAIGTAAFSSIAAGLGSFAGPIGIAAGAVLGSVLGGLIGGPPPTDATEVGGVKLASGQVNPVYQNQESDTGAKYSATNAGVAQAMQTGAGNLAQYLLANGATPKGNITDNNPNLVIKVGSRDGIQVGVQDESTGNGSGAPSAPVYTANLPAGASQAQIIQAVNQTLMNQYNIPPALQAQLNTQNLTSFYSTSNASPSTTTNGNSVPLINAPNQSQSVNETVPQVPQGK